MISPIYTAHCDSTTEEKPMYRFDSSLQRAIACWGWTAEADSRAASRRLAVQQGWVFVGRNCYCPDCQTYGTVADLAPVPTRPTKGTR